MPHRQYIQIQIPTLCGNAAATPPRASLQLLLSGEMLADLQQRFPLGFRHEYGDASTAHQRARRRQEQHRERPEGATGRRGDLPRWQRQQVTQTRGEAHGNAPDVVRKHFRHQQVRQDVQAGAERAARGRPQDRGNDPRRATDADRANQTRAREEQRRDAERAFSGEPHRARAHQRARDVRAAQRQLEAPRTRSQLE